MTNKQKINLVESQPFPDTIQSANTDEAINIFMESQSNKFNDSFSDRKHFSSPQVNEGYSQLEEKYTNTEI